MKIFWLLQCENASSAPVRMVKDELIHEENIANFNISKDLIKEVKLSYTKYKADRKERKVLLEAQQS